jgi:GT2 family glycosyltransferase
MTLSVVILSYNRKDLLINCVKSIEENYKDELESSMEIIVVDNASDKEVLEGVRTYLKGKKNIKLIENKTNLGFGRGCNLGVKRSKGKFVLFLNSDTEVVGKGILDMVKFMEENPSIGIVGGRLQNFDGSSQASAGSFYNLFNFFIMLVGGERAGFLRSSPARIKKVDWVSGACMMVRRDAFEKIGGFDKSLFMYMEDMDLSYRAKKAGISTFYFPDISVKHKSQGSSNRSFAVVNIYKGLLHYFKTHKGSTQYEIVRFSLWLKAVGVYYLGRITGRKYFIETYGEALKLFK